MTPKEKAQDLVNQFRNILMDEDTDCGNEILCTSIAIKNALILVDEIIPIMSYTDNDNDNWVTDEETERYWKQVKKELRKM